MREVNGRLKFSRRTFLFKSRKILNIFSHLCLEYYRIYCLLPQQ